MKCPVCRDPDLAMTSREGVEIDYCPQCRGVWLDRGELDKLIERGGASAGPPEQRPSDYRTPEYREGSSYPRGDSDYRYKKKNPWKELFDF